LTSKLKLLHGSLYYGPDILIEVIEKNTGNLAKIIIGEVKYTANKSYMIQGSEELLEYTSTLLMKSSCYKNLL